jgi:hypothetical protein
LKKNHWLSGKIVRFSKKTVGFWQNRTVPIFLIQNLKIEFSIQNHKLEKSSGKQKKLSSFRQNQLIFDFRPNFEFWTDFVDIHDFR